MKISKLFTDANMQHLICSAVLLWLSLCSVVAQNATVSQQKVTFNKVSVCPSNDSLTQLSKMEGAQDHRTCFVSCAANANCSVLHRTNGICYFGNSTQLTNIFNQNVSQSHEPCVSHTRAAGVVSSEVTSKLILMFDFRQGFGNLINPGIFDATPHGSVTRNSQGAHFPGSNSDYLEVDTQGGSVVTSYLDHPRNFSFFAKVVRQTNYQQSYHYFYDCSAVTTAGRFGDRNGRAWVEHNFPGQSSSTEAVETRQSVASSFLKDNTLQSASVGAVFYGKTLNNFYLNGTNLPTEADQSWNLNALPRCLRLGYDSGNNLALKGRMICYAIAMAALSTAEFQQLDQMCA